MFGCLEVSVFEIEMEIEIGTVASTVCDSIAIPHFHALYFYSYFYSYLALTIDDVILQLLL